MEEAIAVKQTMLQEVSTLLEERGYGGVVSVDDDGVVVSPQGPQSPVEGDVVARMPSVPELGTCVSVWRSACFVVCARMCGVSNMLLLLL